MAKFNTGCLFPIKGNFIPKDIELSDGCIIHFENHGEIFEEVHFCVENGNFFGIEIFAPSLKDARYIVELIAALQAVIDGHISLNMETLIENLSGVRTWFVDNRCIACRILPLIYKNRRKELAITKFYTILDTCNIER